MAEPSNPPPGKVRVVSGDNKTGYVSADNLAVAKAQGWREATEEEAAAKKQRREAASVAGTIQGGFEAVARGASIGGTDLLLEGLGVEGVGARAEALGEIGTGLEVGGAIAASLATGGTGAAAQGAVRGTAAVTAKQIAKRGLGAIAAPTKYATKAATAVERLVLGGAEAAESSLGRRALATAAGGVTEGAIGGLGGAVSESVIQDKPMTAEALVGGALAGAAFGGAASGGASLAGGALGRVLQGLHPRTGKPVADDAIRDVLGVDAGVAPTSVTDELVQAAKKTEPGMLDSIVEQWAKAAPLSGADPEIARRVGKRIIADPEHAADLWNRKGAIEEQVAQTFQDGLTQVQDALSTARKLTGGESKYKSLGTKMPKNADFVAPRITEQLRSSIAAKLDDMEAVERRLPRSYDPGAIREGKELVTRAFGESVDDAIGATETAAAKSFRAMDRLKRDLTEQIKATGGWGAPPMGTQNDVIAANKKLREIYGDVQKHLERDDLWGDAAVAQKEINRAYSAVARAESAFKDGVTGTGLRTLFKPDGSINARQAIVLARQYGRIGGDEVVAKLDAAMQAQVDYLRTISKHVDLGTDGAKQLRSAEDAVEQIRAKFRDQAEDAGFIADMQTLRDAESNSSVSMGVASSIGPAVGGLIGGAALGPVGAAAGIVAGGVLRPYTTARTMASLLSMSKRFNMRFDGKGIVEKLRTGYTKAKAGAVKGIAAAKVPQRATATARGLKLGIAFQLGKLSAEEKANGIERMADQISKLSNADELEKMLGPEFEILSTDAPETATAVQETVARLVTFLQASLPRIYKDEFTGRPPLVNGPEADRFLRRAQAALDPRSVIKSFYAGTITTDEVRALREVYPATYAAMASGAQEAVMEASERRRPIPYEGRVRLSVLLGQPLDPLMRPSSRRKMQALYARAQSQGQEPAQPMAASRSRSRLKTTGSVEAITSMGTVSEITATRKQRI